MNCSTSHICMGKGVHHRNDHRQLIRLKILLHNVNSSVLFMVSQYHVSTYVYILRIILMVYFTLLYIQESFVQ